MSIASKTVLLQMRFIGKGAPFCDVTAKSSIDTTNISAYTDAGHAFYGVNTEITPPTYASSKAISRMGAPFRDTAAKPTIDAHYGFSDAGHGFWAQFAGTSVYPAAIRRPIRTGAPFRDTVAKTSINAEDMLYIDAAHPFWVKYAGAPAPFNTTRFFLLF